MNEEEKDIVKIVLHYADGTTKEINQGFVASVDRNESAGKATMTFEMVHISGSDLSLIVEGVIQFGVRMGMFGDPESAGDES